MAKLLTASPILSSPRQESTERHLAASLVWDRFTPTERACFETIVGEWVNRDPPPHIVAIPYRAFEAAGARWNSIAAATEFLQDCGWIAQAGFVKSPHRGPPTRAFRLLALGLLAYNNIR